MMTAESVIELARHSKRRPVIIGIDGMCASGKTTLAEKLSAKLCAPVIHTDDFFIRAENRTGNQPFNIDLERFTAQAAVPMSENAEFDYGVFDCSCQKITSVRHVQKSRFYIVEGCYSLCPPLAGIYAVKVFMSVSPRLQLQRLEKRETAESLKAFKSKWIPLETKYFKEYKIKEGCDIVL